MANWNSSDYCTTYNNTKSYEQSFMRLSDKIMFPYKNTLNMLHNKAERSWFASLIKKSISLQTLAH